MVIAVVKYRPKDSPSDVRPQERIILAKDFLAVRTEFKRLISPRKDVIVSINV